MEKVYHYIWQSRMFGRRLRDNCGNEIEVVDPGSHNFDSGPDFFNSKIKIGGTEWIGNVEIHVKASDWYRHGHHNDPAYDNIILHVVGVSDKDISRKNGELIPQVELSFPEDFFKTLSHLAEDQDAIRCATLLSSLPSILKEDWLETLSVERLQSKAKHVIELLDYAEGSWEQVCFILFARSLGFGINSDPFEMLAKSLPLKVLHHHSDNALQLQALLFGQAGMLDSSAHIFDEFYQALCSEYYFLARKYNLRPLVSGSAVWKYARTRPQNFPHRRIALLGKACEGGFRLFSEIISAASDEDRLRNLFDYRFDGYWHSHFSFDTEARMAADTLSFSSVSLILINLVAPLIYAYASVTGNIDLAEKPMSILENMPAEANSIVRGWQNAGIHADNALKSQALIHLKKNYCDARKCLYCRFGNHLLRRASLM